MIKKNEKIVKTYTIKRKYPDPDKMKEISLLGVKARRKKYTLKERQAWAEYARSKKSAKMLVKS